MIKFFHKGQYMENEILNYVKQKTLKNYFNSDREFVKLFPSEDFDFSTSKYTHFLYFDKEEASAYLLDFMLFIKAYYKAEVFSYANYYSILNEFKKYMDNNNIFLYLKTKMGLKIANYNNELLLHELKQLFGNNHFVGNENNIAFSETLLKDKKEFTYNFFNYLIEKLNGYNNYKFIVEPLTKSNKDSICNYFKGVKYESTPPFFLNSERNYAKETKKLLLDKLLNDGTQKIYSISKDNTCKCLIIANIINSVCDLSIICDSEYYDSDLSYPIDFICRNLFDNYDIKKIITINDNKGIAYSGINSSLIMSRFKPDYSLNSELNGYSKIKYELSKEDSLEIEQHIDNSLIQFVF